MEALKSLPVWVSLPLLLGTSTLALIVLVAFLRACVLLAEAAWRESLRMTAALTRAFARAGMLTFSVCGWAVHAAVQVLWWLICVAWTLTAGRVVAIVVAHAQALHERARLWDHWRREFSDEFATFAEFLYAFEHGGRRRDEQEEPRFNSGPQHEERRNSGERKRPPPDPQQAAYSAACRLLGLPEAGFSLEQLNTRYRLLISASHPDRGGNTQRAAAINAARLLIKLQKGWS